MIQNHEVLCICCLFQLPLLLIYQLVILRTHVFFRHLQQSSYGVLYVSICIHIIYSSFIHTSILWTDI